MSKFDLHQDIKSHIVTFLESVDLIIIKNGDISAKHVQTFANYGYLNLLKYIVNDIHFPMNTVICTDNNIDISAIICMEAACGGHLDVLQWARERGVFMEY